MRLQNTTGQFGVKCCLSSN